MALAKVRLSELLLRSDERNIIGKYGLSDVRGMSIEKHFIATKAKMEGVSLASYKIVRPDSFAYVPVTSRNGDRITIAHNDSSTPYIVSSSYEVFKVADSHRLDSRYLYMFFNRDEFDRYARFNSWGSARETFSWDDFCDTPIELPPIETQRKYVAIYKTMLANQQDCEKSLADLKLACDALLDRCKTSPRIRLDKLITEVDARNVLESRSIAMGVTLDHTFTPSKTTLSDISKYKIVKPGQLACNLIHVGRDKAFPIAKNDTNNIILTSPDYAVFQPISAAIGTYLLGWFSRKETGRFGWFICDADIRGRLNKEMFLSLEIPIPENERLITITSLLEALKARISINDRLKYQLKDVCSVLIRGSILEASR